jgi:hypothetical protein
MNTTIKFSLSLLLLTSALVADETVVPSQQSNYRDIVQGSLSANYIVPISDNYTGLVEESWGDPATKISVDLLLLQKYYGGLYLGYQQDLTQDTKAFYIEKRLSHFALMYKNIRSSYDATPDTTGTITFVDANDVATTGVNKHDQNIDYSYDKIELKYYAEENIKDRGWVSLFYEKIQTGIAGEEHPVGSGSKSYYTEGSIENYGFYFGAEQLDYLMDDGFDVTKIGASIGTAKVNYTDSLEYEDGDMQLTTGVNLEFAYKKSFNEYSAFIFAVYGDFVKIGGLMEYGTLGARCALTF